MILEIFEFGAENCKQNGKQKSMWRRFSSVVFGEREFFYLCLNIKEVIMWIKVLDPKSPQDSDFTEVSKSKM